MTRKNCRLRSVLLAVLCLALAVGYGVFAYAQTGTVFPTRELWDGLPNLHFIDVGQGDCTLVTYHGDAVLIDAGPIASGPVAAEYVRMHAPVLDYFVITHPHEDHMGGAADVLRAVRVETLVLSAVDVEAEYVRNAIAAAEQQGTTILRLNEPTEFAVGAITVEILDVFGFAYEDLNDASMVSRVTVGETMLLVTGDAEEGLEGHLLGTDRDALDCDILKIGHHGSASSTTADFLAAVSPEACVISVGRQNAYGHPSETVVARIRDAGAVLHRTDRAGHIHLRGETAENTGLRAMLGRLLQAIPDKEREES